MADSDAGASTSANSVLNAQKPAAVIYTHSLLEGSMTFIKSQAEALINYIPVFAGAHRVDGLELPRDRTYVVNDRTPLGAIREALFRQWGYAPSLVRKLRAHRPQIVHAHFGTCGPSGMTLSEKLQIPLVVTFHGHDATMDNEEAVKTYRGRELLKHKDRLIHRAGAFIAVSNYIRRRLLAQGYPENKIIVHRNGIDLDYFRPSNDAAREPIVLFVGRFTEKKGARYLIEAASEIYHAGVAFELVLIGSGPLESDLKDAAANARIPCRFTGFLSTREIRSWLQRASVVAIPSVTAANGDAEGLPTILLEAQAMETPVVTTRHSGIPEGMIEGVTGELTDERNVPALATLLRSFLEHPSKARAFGKAGRRFVTEYFGMRTQVDGLEAIYARLNDRHLAESSSAVNNIQNS